MERPPKKYVCEKCGYLGNTSEHEGCDYLAWTTVEQLYIDHLEAELAALRASPASAPESVSLLGIWERRAQDALPADAMLINRHIRELRESIATAPTPPSTEERKDAERWKMELRGRANPEQHTASIDAAISAMQEDKP